MVAPTWLLMSSPTMGRFTASKRWRHSASRAMKTGMQLTTPTPASRACSMYQRVAVSLPTGR